MRHEPYLPRLKRRQIHAQDLQKTERLINGLARVGRIHTNLDVGKFVGHIIYPKMIESKYM